MKNNPTSKKNVKIYTRGEEIANSITHGIGAALSIAGLATMVVLAVIYGDVWKIVSVSIYGSTLIMLYLASTFYHSFQKPEIKRFFKILDHAAIYFLIAGTYTPFALVSLRGGWGWSLFGVIWGLAITGIILKVIFIQKFKKLSLVLYILMGWICVIAIKQMLIAVPIAGMIWLFIGGLFYTVGVVFYTNKKIPYSHAIWHLFVLAGSICHYFSILFYLLLKN